MVFSKLSMVVDGILPTLFCRKWPLPYATNRNLLSIVRSPSFRKSYHGVILEAPKAHERKQSGKQNFWLENSPRIQEGNPCTCSNLVETLEDHFFWGFGSSRLRAFYVFYNPPSTCNESEVKAGIGSIEDYGRWTLTRIKIRSLWGIQGSTTRSSLTRKTPSDLVCF